MLDGDSRRRVLWRAAMGLLLAVTPFISASAIASPSPSPSSVTTSPDQRGGCPHGYVALSFDDGPDPTTTPRLAEILTAHRARGTFFVVGAIAAAHPDIIRRLRVDGMIVGNHSYDHPFLDQLGADDVRRELQETNDVLDGLAGPAPVLFRPPYGRTNETVETAARSLGMTEVLWTHDSDDYEGASAEHLIEVARRAKDGDVLLFHDGLRSTVDAIPRILTDLTARGLCSGQIVPSTVPKRAWVEYAGEDRTFYFARTTRW
ncbi:polysaccharide deacetylase family protein [Actinomycetospora callitridis]|uniref:polysaccharide deacetylase family protein n=1 Tax=Actinomycetospora callitridis TaxID=913944 RepID=UPI002365CA33|nr:polysaccharide deacetylase family protein [Actinomycetospora callitridis]MDD7921229.1 polysaccharide deacetylase family protein [Actinomycetospora callitridis]